MKEESVDNEIIDLTSYVT